MKNKDKAGKKLFPKVKKEIRDFCFSEEGRISKKSVVQVGLTLAMLGVAINPAQAGAVHTSNFPSSHSNLLDSVGHHSSTHNSHASHPSHASHNSHGSHGQW